MPVILSGLALFLWAVAFEAHPAGDSPGRVVVSADWGAMSARQRAALAPLQRDWPALTNEQKQQWQEVASRFDRLPPVERERIQARMSEWARLTPSERGRARLGFQEARQITPGDRQARWQAYQSMPLEQRQQLADRAAAPVASPPRPAAPAAGTAKRNTVQAQRAPAPRPVTPTAIQAGPGATTTLMSRQAAPPPHHQPGLPKIAAMEGFVDAATLLPRRGPQGAGRLDGASAISGATPP